MKQIFSLGKNWTHPWVGIIGMTVASNDYSEHLIRIPVFLKIVQIEKDLD